MTFMDAPQYPAGSYEVEENYSPARRAELISEIARAPSRLAQAVSDLSSSQLETRYKNWTIRQIVHHIADSHINSYVRFKWALTENKPTIKSYNEGDWAALADARTGDVAVPLALLEALHAKWAQLLRVMKPEDFSRSFFHPETGETVSLSRALSYYAWHCRHHTGQILWIRKHRM